MFGDETAQIIDINWFSSGCSEINQPKPSDPNQAEFKATMVRRAKLQLKMPSRPHRPGRSIFLHSSLCPRFSATRQTVSSSDDIHLDTKRHASGSSALPNLAPNSIQKEGRYAT
jgi:hypothetical protein